MGSAAFRRRDSWRFRSRKSSESPAFFGVAEGCRFRRADESRCHLNGSNSRCLPLFFSLDLGRSLALAKIPFESFPREYPIIRLMWRSERAWPRYRREIGGEYERKNAGAVCENGESRLVACRRCHGAGPFWRCHGLLIGRQRDGPNGRERKFGREDRGSSGRRVGGLRTREGHPGGRPRHPARRLTAQVDT